MRYTLQLKLNSRVFLRFELIICDTSNHFSFASCFSFFSVLFSNFFNQIHTIFYRVQNSLFFNQVLPSASKDFHWLGVNSFLEWWKTFFIWSYFFYLCVFPFFFTIFASFFSLDHLFTLIPFFSFPLFQPVTVSTFYDFRNCQNLGLSFSVFLPVV